MLSDLTPSPNPTAEISSLDPEKDCERIAFLLANQLFPYTIEKALEYALFKTYAVPSISRILAATGEFTERAQKRYDDTVLLLAEVSENGQGHPDAELALDRINEMHGRFRIRNEDFLYTLSTFVFEPIRALQLYGPRPMTPHEQRAWFNAYVQLGEGMKIADLPANPESFRNWRQAYEQREIRFEPTNRVVADATVEVLQDILRVPKFARGLALSALVVVMEPHVARAFGYPAPHPAMAASVNAFMTVRKIVAGLLPDRRTVRLQTKRNLPTYRGDYSIAELGTFARR
ncbi:MAG: DUF2236 domain-containing protein [Novosphingobium sp.]|nr:DUF2236 domain-containing protein [Novosphingobium sp.]